MTIKLIGEWSVLGVILGLAIYIAITVKNEKKQYLKRAYQLKFAGLSFLIPHWWSQQIDSDNQVSFIRSDTYYDWKVKIIDLPGYLSPDVSLKQAVAQYIKSLNIIFDTEQVIIENGKNSIRIEGTGTQNEEKRIYLDIFLLKASRAGDAIVALSQSSVLNGAVEGPFFEEMMRNMLNSETNFS